MFFGGDNRPHTGPAREYGLSPWTNTSRFHWFKPHAVLCSQGYDGDNAHVPGFHTAIFLGVPDESTALSVLPAHQLLFQGKALDAVKITAYGSLVGLAFALLFLIPALYVIPIIYKSSRGFVVYILIIFVILLILREKREYWATGIFLIAGFFGLLALNLKIISSNQVLFLVFAGLFGISTSLNSLKSKTPMIPQEEFSTVKVDKSFLGSGLLGSIGGMLVGGSAGNEPVPDRDTDV